MADNKNLPAVQGNRDVAEITEDAFALLREAPETNDFGSEDLFLPWLSLVQNQGGYRKKNHENYVEDAQEGDIIDNLSRIPRATQQIIICKYDGVHYSTWEPDGGRLVKQWFGDPTGFVAAKYPDPEKPWGAKVDADGNEVKPSPTYYILAIDPETGVAVPMCWALTGTQAKKNKKVNAMANAPIFGPGGVMAGKVYARIFDLSSRTEVGGADGKKSWAGWVVTPGPLVLANAKYGKGWHEAALAFRKAVEEGKVRPSNPFADDENQGVGGEVDSDERRYEDQPAKSEAQDATFEPVKGDKIPF